VRDLVGLQNDVKSPIWGKLYRLRENDPTWFLYDFVFYGVGYRAVGLKFKYEELSLPVYKDLLEKVRSDKSIHILHLRRRNLLRRYVSQLLAIRRNVFNVNKAKDVPPLKRVSVSPHDCLVDIDNIRRWENFFAKIFDQHPLINLYYEDLIRQQEKWFHETQIFLGVAPMSLKLKTVKLLPQALSEIVENFSELRAYFAGTAHQHFLVEP